MQPQKGEVVKQADQRMKRNCAQAGHYTYDDGEQRKPEQPDSRETDDAYSNSDNSFEWKFIAE